MEIKGSIRYGLLLPCAVLTAGLVVSGVSLAAQEPGGGMPSTGQQPQGQSMPQEGTAGPGDNGTPGMTSYAASSFVRNTLENNQAQEQMSQLAAQKAQGEDVKQFGQQMMNVHQKLDEQLAPLAKQLSVSQPKGPSKKDKKEIDKLQSLSGTDFDNEYLQAMGSAQQQSLKNFNTESKDSQNPSAQQSAQADTPVLEQNYQILQKVAQAHSINLDAVEKK